MTDAREPLHRTSEEIAEDEEFFRWYGPWAPLDPQGLVEFTAGFNRPWWIVGGWSIDAFTGIPREHEDVDLSLLACDLPAFREHVGDRWNLWSNHGGTLRPFNDRHPEVLDAAARCGSGAARTIRGSSTSRSLPTSTVSGPASATPRTSPLSRT